MIGVLLDVYVRKLLHVSETVFVVLCFSHVKRQLSAEQEKLRTDDTYTKAGVLIVICVIACHGSLLCLNSPL